MSSSRASTSRASTTSSRTVPLAPPAHPSRQSLLEQFSRFARWVSSTMAHPVSFTLALMTVLVWAACGPLFDFSETWQLVINTGTTIVTFLMIFILQHTQNRDARAAQIKLDELLRAMRGARNELIDLENLTEEELSHYCREFQELHVRYARTVANRRGAAPDAEMQVTTEVRKEGDKTSVKSVANTSPPHPTS